MNPREYKSRESERYRAFQEIDKEPTRAQIGPHSCSLFSAALDGPPHEYLTPSHLQFIDWPAAQNLAQSPD
jgi:hypothetical protein